MLENYGGKCVRYFRYLLNCIVYSEYSSALLYLDLMASYLECFIENANLGLPQKDKERKKKKLRKETNFISDKIYFPVKSFKQ